ncbi:MAG: tRNA pseudouridine(55) synthase [Candidatus Westeberhardia cardiocondylae]|nr:tRNA pseudouridine(55) synthase [Candidatus Westeberhardia cardiocondylae]
MYYRNIHGVVFLDKPVGLSSNIFLQKVKVLLRVNKAGYIGTLDPQASGMLPICFGEATKFSQYLLNTSKHYRVVAKLGEKTDTFDSEGNIINIRPVNINLHKLKIALSSFFGRINQIPPMFSAIKYQGKPLYKYARKGVFFSRKVRSVFVYNLKLIYYDKISIAIDIICSKGTYIRAIIDDLGEKLGCGAHVISLRRLGIGVFSSSCMVDFEKLKSKLYEKDVEDLYKKEFFSINNILLDMPIINLSSHIVEKIKCGESVIISTNLLKSGLVCLIEKNINKNFIGIGRISISTGKLIPVRLVTRNKIVKSFI